jgi:hypothetical protein
MEAIQNIQWIDWATLADVLTARCEPFTFLTGGQRKMRETHQERMHRFFKHLFKKHDTELNSTPLTKNQIKWSDHYWKLINRAVGRALPEGTYTEGHHAIPKCLHGDNKLIVELTPEEHFVAHQLLAKIHPDNSGLIYAAHAMTIGAKTNFHHRNNNKLFGWIRRKMQDCEHANAVPVAAGGITYKSQSEAARKLGISRSTLNSRIEEHGDNVEEILKPVKYVVGCTVKGVKYRTMQEASNVTGITVKALEMRRRKGWADLGPRPKITIVKVPKEVKRDNSVSYMGVVYPSLSALASAFGFKAYVLSDRLKAGWTLEQALNKALMSRSESGGFRPRKTLDDELKERKADRLREKEAQKADRLREKEAQKADRLREKENMQKTWSKNEKYFLA